MIDNALTLLRDELDAYFTRTGNPTSVVIDNIALWETENNENLKDSVVITLVNVEEEATLKNRTPYKRNPNGTINYEQPPIFINLYLLISANFSGSRIKYLSALTRLSSVLQFFQNRRSFTIANSPNTDLGQNGTPEELEDLREMKLYVEFHTLNFEQINHLWGSLGGKQMPFALYKARLVKLQEREPLLDAPLIEEIDLIVKKIPDSI